MLKLRLQYFDHLMWRTNSLEETLMLGKIGGGEGDDRGWDGWMASPTRWTWVWASFGSWWWTGKPGVLQSMGSQRVRQDWATQLNWRSLFALIWELKKIKSVTVSIVSPFICHEVMGPDAMILVFWMLNFKPAFALLSLSSRGSLVLLRFLP